MQNNFEKEVRQKLNEMRMQPSQPVWEKVQLEIQPERKKRRGIFGLLLLAGVGGVGVLMLLNKDKAPAPQQHSTFETTSNERQEEVAIKTSAHSEQASSTATNKPKKDTVFISNNSALLSQTKRIQFARSLAEASPMATVSKKSNPIKEREEQLVPAIKSRNAVEQNFLVRPTVVGLVPVLLSPSINIPTDGVPLSHQLSIVTDAIKAVDSLQKRNDSSAKLVRSTKPGWRKMAAVSVGYSSYSSGLFNLIGVEKAMQADVRSPLYSGVGNNNPVVITPQSAAPSSSLPGLSVFIAGFVEKPISRRTELMLGLSYSYHRIVQPLGMLNGFDTTVNSAGRTIALSSFYTTGDSNRYTNRIHAISLPIGINWQVHRRLPMFASIAVAYGRIISIDAVAYSASSNLFFKENADEDYLKHQLPLSIGLAYRFRIGTTQSLAVGPTATYNLLQLNTTASSGGQHLSFVGIQTSLRF